METRYSILSFIFDGVPRPGEKSVDPRRRKNKQKVQQNRSRVKPLFFHEPYRNKECSRCHPQERVAIRQLARTEGFCFRCHEHSPFKERLAGYRHTHGPVAVKNCLVCHRPHTSRYEHLAVAPLPYLCYQCHAPTKVRAQPAHSGPSGEKCLECHDPHGADDPFLLRKEESA